MDRYLGKLSTDVYGVLADEARIARLKWNEQQAAAADDDGVHAAVHGATEAQEVTTDIAAMPCARNITVTGGGTAADIKAGDVTVYGENMAGEAISEAFTFTDNTGGAKTGNKAFAKVTKIAIPAQDGTGCTFKVGFGDKLGLPYKLDSATEVTGILNGVVESTKPTLATSGTAVESNTVDLNSALNGKTVEVLLTL